MRLYFPKHIIRKLRPTIQVIFAKRHLDDDQRRILCNLHDGQHGHKSPSQLIVEGIEVIEEVGFGNDADYDKLAKIKAKAEEVVAEEEQAEQEALAV